MSNPVKYEKFDEESQNQTLEYSQKVINLETTAKSEDKPEIPSIAVKVQKEMNNLIRQEAIKQTTSMISSARQQVSSSILNKFNTKIEFIRKYFDVDLEDIQMKLKTSIVPLNKEFQLLAEKKPDLYGPFWIYATLVFIVAVAGNLSGYLNVFSS
jgi:uncharacterized protein with HEPN domain